jgi:hypothetical protein
MARDSPEGCAEQAAPSWRRLRRGFGGAAFLRSMFQNVMTYLRIVITFQPVV